MALVRWEPVRELNTIQGEINRLFNTFFETPVTAGEGAGRRWLPPMDLVEADDHYVLRADLPGLSEDDVRIEVENNVLTISGERKAEHEERREGYHRLERAYGAFSRSLTLPDGVDPDAVQARFDRGVLEVRVPKPEQRKPQRVTIKVGGDGAKPATIEGRERSSGRETASGGERSSGGESGSSSEHNSRRETASGAQARS
jgi:HSP20 family protein